MPLKEEFEAQGSWLFKWRSYLPVFSILLFVLAFVESDFAIFHVMYTKLWELFCLLISFAGLSIRAFTVGFVPTRTSGRNTKCQVADTLNTKGMYSAVRHPLYLGNYLIILGMSLLLLVWWLPVILSLTFWVYYERIMFAEEAFLRGKFGDKFMEWASETPAFIPRFRKWESPELSLSLITIIKREYTGFFGIASLYTILHFCVELFMTGKVSIDMGWIVFFTLSLVTYLTAIVVKKKTRLLHEKGR